MPDAGPSSETHYTVTSRKSICQVSTSVIKLRMSDGNLLHLGVLFSCLLPAIVPTYLS